MRNKKIGIVLMTYGSANTSEHVEEYFKHIYKNPPSEVIADFKHRYDLVGGSPLVRITKKQASLLEKKLGKKYVVQAGMRHSKPFIAEAVAACKKAGAAEILDIILSPHFSSYIMEGYKKDFVAAAQASDYESARVALPWPTEKHFVELLAKRIQTKLKKYGLNTPVVFTTHSLPRRVVDADPSYLKQLEKTIHAVRAKLPKIESYQGYQSAGHTPEEWLNPDLKDILAELRKKGRSKVLIVPIQFLANHLEILYDLDIAAKEQCQEFGISYHRIELPNTNPLFIKALASIQSEIPSSSN